MAVDRVIAVMGVGPGLGASVARRFAREDFSVALLARSPNQIEPEAEQIRHAGGKALPVQVDVCDPDALSDAFQRIRKELGRPEVLVHNAGRFLVGTALDVTPAELEETWRVSALGALVGAQAVLPDMLAAGRGTLLFTGATASLRGGARFAALASAKFALRALTQSMARAYGPEGVHVVHVVIDGQIDTPMVRELQPGRDPRTLLNPDSIAEIYWQLHAQPRSTWTHELDLRPSPEAF